MQVKLNEKKANYKKMTILAKTSPKAISCGTALRTEKSFYFRAAKPDAQNSVDNLIMTRVFQIVFR